MSFIDMFIERTDDKPKTAKQESIFNKSNSFTAHTDQTTVHADDMGKFDAHFDELFGKSNFSGADYYEFIQMVGAMGDGLSDDIKFVAAFKGLMAQGLTKEKLLSTAQKYLDILDNDSVQFNQAIDTKIISDVNNKKADVEARKQKVKDKEDLIIKMQAEILQENQDIVALSNEAAEQEKKASGKSSIYKSACENRKRLIQSDIQKINSLIK